jgi:low temperature requirement protein LtrA
VTEPTSTDDTTAAARERHATNLELFLDLVFVFAVTQIASTIAHDPTAAGLGRGLLLAWLVWWQWSQFTWAGSAIDLQAVTATRVMVLCIIPVALIMTASIPTAFHDGGLWFGAAYMGVQLIVLSMQGHVAMESPATRRSFIRYASFAMAAPLVVMAGAFLHGEARIAVWVVAALMNLVGAYRGAGGDWAIDPVHFAERHALFIIISLGEVLVAVGATATDAGLTARTVTALVVAVAMACVLWWTYFAYIPEVGEHLLRQSKGGDRGRLARDMFTLGHFPLAFGLILYAVVAKHLVEHPTQLLGADDRWILGLSVVTYIGGLSAIQWRAVHRVAPERWFAIGLGCLVPVLGRWLQPLLVVGLMTVALGVMHTVTLRRMDGRLHRKH